MRHIKVIVPRFHEYPLIISRFFYVIYILIRNGLLTEIERLSIIDKKYKKVLNNENRNFSATVEKSSKFCPNCGASIPSNSKFCGGCGTVIS